MRIAIVGCGALGGFYGAKLSRAGPHDVTFLLRSDFHAVRQRGFEVRSREGDFLVHPHCARRPDEIGPVDLVVIGLKTTANDQFPSLLPPLVGSKTAVLTLQNGLGNEEALARLFPPEQILGGLCFVCLNRIAPGVVQHIDHGRVVIGEFQRPSIPRTHEIATAFREADIPCEVTEDLARAHWEKLVWNIPFNGLGVASSAGVEAVRDGTLGKIVSPRGQCLTTDRLLEDREWHRLARELMGEIVRTGQALGLGLSEDLVEVNIQRTTTMGAYKPSTLIDFERGQELELESLFCEPLRRAQGAGVATPRLQALVRILQEQARRGAPG